MRIIVAGPPKTGNIWIKCLLSQVYNLEVLYRPPQTDVAFNRAVQDGWFPDGSIFHQHFAPTPLFLETTSTLNCTLVTIIRNPYDAFVSLYYFVQNFPKQFAPNATQWLPKPLRNYFVRNFPKRFARAYNPLHRIYGKPIDHPEVLAFIRDTSGGYGIHLLSAKNWLESGRSIILRYEDLKAAPARALGEVAAQIQAVDESALQSAVETCGAENMRKIFKRYRKHIREGKVGDWRNHLTAAHLEALKTHALWIEALGYEVFEPELADPEARKP